MPIYEYACACGKTFEAMILRRSDEEEVRCPACRGAEVRRVLSGLADTKRGLSLKPRKKFKKVR